MTWLWGGVAQANTSFEFGFGRVDITPAAPIRLSGYAARATRSEGVAQALFASAAAIRQKGNETALMLSIDNCGLSKELRDQFLDGLKERHGITAERLVIFNSHTHSAPCLSNALPNLFVEGLSDEDHAIIHRYTGSLLSNMTVAADQALATLQPGTLHWTQGAVGFARNRRTAGGPVDHSLPLLVFKGQGGEVRGVVANYACHCTTLTGNLNHVHPDWAGVAREMIQTNHPGATALVAIGCGADSNPLPRGSTNHVENYGRQIADEVQRLLAIPLLPLTQPIEFRARTIGLRFDRLPNREEWEARAMQPGIVGFHARKNLERLNSGEGVPRELLYQLQTWSFGPGLAMVFLPGEVVVDYALRLKQEVHPRPLWVSAYCNWVPCYIPSRRILAEGGYEAETSLWYYDQPARMGPHTEDLIVNGVLNLLSSSGDRN